MEKEERQRRREEKRKLREQAQEKLTLADIIRAAGPDPIKMLKPMTPKPADLDKVEWEKAKMEREARESEQEALRIEQERLAKEKPGITSSCDDTSKPSASENDVHTKLDGNPEQAAVAKVNEQRPSSHAPSIDREDENRKVVPSDKTAGPDLEDHVSCVYVEQERERNLDGGLIADSMKDISSSTETSSPSDSVHVKPSLDQSVLANDENMAPNTQNSTETSKTTVSHLAQEGNLDGGVQPDAASPDRGVSPSSSAPNSADNNNSNPTSGDADN
jgi:hypothetical protein